MLLVGVAFFVSFVGLGLVFQDLRDEAAVRFRGDEDGRHLQGSHWSWLACCLLSFVLLDVPCLRLGQGGPGRLGWQVGVTMVTPCGVWWWW